MADKPVTFHSENIRDTKAHEKREVFVNVEQKKTIKQSAEEFQKKFAAAKAHAAESRAKIENPGADEHGVVASRTRKPFPTKTFLKIFIPVLLLAGAGFAVYHFWPAIHHEFFEVSEARARELIEKDPKRFIEMYDKLIAEAKDEDEKILLLYNRIGMLDQYYGSKYASQMLNDAYTANELLPCYETAEQIVWLEEAYGTEAKAEEWRTKLETLEKEGLVLGDG